MNFTEQIKNEILSKQIKDNHCKKAFIVGLIRGSGVLYENEGELGLEFKVPDEQTAMMISLAFSQLFGYEIREVSVTEDLQNNKDKYSAIPLNYSYSNSNYQTKDKTSVSEEVSSVMKYSLLVDESSPSVLINFCKFALKLFLCSWVFCIRKEGIYRSICK